MLDIRIVREQPDFVKSRLALRCGGDEEKIDELLRVDEERRKAETALQGLNAERKKLSKEIGGMRSRGQDSLELENRVRKIGEDIARLNEDVNLADGQQKEMLREIPNLPHLKVPIGKDASGTSRLILSDNIYELTEAAPEKAPFAFGKLKIVPKADALFSNKDDLNYFVEINNPGIDTATNLPKLQMGIDLISKGQTVSRLPLSEAMVGPLSGKPGPGRCAARSSAHTGSRR